MHRYCYNSWHVYGKIPLRAVEQTYGQLATRGGRASRFLGKHLSYGGRPNDAFLGYNLPAKFHEELVLDPYDHGVEGKRARNFAESP